MILEKWANTFISMVLEALPFILIGSIISALIQMYISEDLVKKILPKSKFISIIFAAFIGVFIPIVNPVVITSTYYAFNDIRIILIRFIGGILCSIVIGTLMLNNYREFNGYIIKKKYKYYK